MDSLAIIPARSGSKGLKDKNIKKINGIPLLAYSVQSALESGEFSHVLVSTDSVEYAKIAVEYGAEVPFMRNEASASDTASSWAVVKEVLENYRDMGISFDIVTLLQPTSPLRKAEDIQKAFMLFREKKAKAVISVCEVEHSPLWSNTIPENLSMNGFLDKRTNTQRQCLETYYRINGAIYIVDVERFLMDSNIYGEGSFAYVMPRERSIDIDTSVDFVIAETLMNYIK